MNWWLTPGGHTDLKEAIYPHLVAINKCSEEAGLSVRLINESQFQNNYAGCDSIPSPHFCYLLEIPDTSTCAKGKHHKTHFDLTFVGTVIDIGEVEHEGSLDRKKVELRLDMNKEEIQEAMIKAIKEGSTSKIDGSLPFPVDLPARIDVALRLLKSSSWLDQHGRKELT